jgi:hypothetical protein
MTAGMSRQLRFKQLYETIVSTAGNVNPLHAAVGSFGLSRLRHRDRTGATKGLAARRRREESARQQSS